MAEVAIPRNWCGDILRLWGGISDRLRRDVMGWIVSQKQFTVHQSDWKWEGWLDDKEPPWGCPEPDQKLVSGSCIERKNIGASGAVGPVFSDERHFKCYRYGGEEMFVRATAMCFRVPY
jgi:hypothetical protein